VGVFFICENTASLHFYKKKLTVNWPASFYREIYK